MISKARTGRSHLAGRPAAARRLLLIAVLLGVGLRVALLLALGAGQPTYEFGVIGANLAHGRGYSYFAETPAGMVSKPLVGSPQPGAFEPPIYPAVVAVVDKAVGDGANEVRALQALNLALFVLLAIVLFKLGETLFGPDVGAIVALGAALYPSFVYMTSQVSASNLYLPAEAGLLLAAIALLRELSRRNAVIAGALAALVCLLRPDGVVLLVVVAALVVWATRRSAKWATTVAPVVALFLIVALAPLAAWCIRNSVAMGRPTATITTQAGFVLWEGNHQGATGSGKTDTKGAAAIARENALFARVDHLSPGDDYELRRDAIFRHEALSWIRGHPTSAALGIAKKTFLLGVLDPEDRRSLNPGYLLSWGVLVVFAALGLYRLRPRGLEWTLIGLYALINFFVPVVLVVLPRYRLPVDMVAMMPAAWLVAQSSAYHRLWSRRWPAEASIV